MIGNAYIRDSIRPLRRRKGITAIIILTLALGVGVNAGVFSVFHQVLLQELEVPSPDELVILHSAGPRSGSVSTNGTGRDAQVFSYPMFEDLRAASDRLTGIAAFRAIAANLGARGETVSGSGLLVSGNYFDVLEISPMAGRFFRPDELLAAGGPRLVVLANGFWRDRFGGDPSVIGERVVVNGEALEVIGIAPEGFRGLNRLQTVDVFVPVTLAAEMVVGNSWNLEERRSYWLYLFGRLVPDAGIAEAEASLASTFSNIMRNVETPLQQAQSENWMQRFSARTLELLPGARGQSNTLETARSPLTLLLVVAGLVLLVACVNITNLLLALGASERGENAVRQALGAGRRHVIGQRLAVLAVLALAGAVVGLPVAMATLRLVLFLLPASDSAVMSATLDWRIVAAGLVVSVIAMLLAGLVPIIQALGSRPMEAIREQVARSGQGRAATRFRAVLVTGQIALALSLLAISGLFIKSLANINGVDLGLTPEPVLSFAISPARNGYSPEQSRQFFMSLEQGLGALPGVASASVSLVPILSETNWNNDVSVQGFEASPDTDTNASFNAVGPDFFSTLSIGLLRGRDFEAHDTDDRPKVALVNQAFMEKFDLGDEVIGLRMAPGSGSGVEPDMEIVGVVADAAYSTVKDRVPPQYFVPIYQTTDVGSASFYVRATGDPESLIPAVRKLVAGLDPNLPIENLATLDIVLLQTLVLDRIISMLAMVFAALATTLAAVGLFGVLTFALAQRTGEIGLRAALGAAPAALRRMVLLQTLRLTLVGAGVGLLLAWMLGRMARGLLFELSPLDPAVMLGAVLLLVGVVMLAGWLPARRASRIHPVQALRYQ